LVQTQTNFEQLPWFEADTRDCYVHKATEGVGTSREACADHPCGVPGFCSLSLQTDGLGVATLCWPGVILQC